MDYKRTTADKTTQTRDIKDFNEITGNIYETISMLSKRSNQIAQDLKQELYRKIEEFTSSNDSLEEVFENSEQIEITRFYEQLPKPTLIAINEYLNQQLVYRNSKEEKATIDSMIADLQLAQSKTDTKRKTRKKSEKEIED